MCRLRVVGSRGALGILAGVFLHAAQGSWLDDTRTVPPLGAASLHQVAGTANDTARTAVDVVAVVNGKPLRAQGAGQCRHEPNGFIYGAAASLWTVEFADPNGPLQYLSLSLWRPKGRRDYQVSLDLQTGTGSHRIATVRGGALAGSGTAAFQPRRSGGLFEVRGQDAGGDTIAVTIACAHLGSVTAEGG